MKLKNKKERLDLLERVLFFLAICSCAIAGYSAISEFINDKDNYFIVENPMSDVG